MIRLNILRLDPGSLATGGGAPAAAGTSPPAAGGAPVDWKASLPEDLRSNPVFTAVPDVNTLAKNYLNAQQLIGAKRIALPGPTASEMERAEFFKSIGRPESFDKYSEPTVKPAAELNIGQESVAKARETMFKLGLTDEQQKGLMDFYYTGLNETHKGLNLDMQASKQASETALKTEWGSNYEANMGVVTEAVKRFATPEALDELNTGIGNNVNLVKMFHNMGKALLEDKTPTGGSGVPPAGSVQAAQTRLSELQLDKNFITALTNNQDPGHAAAVELWAQVHKQATADNKKIE